MKNFKAGILFLLLVFSCHALAVAQPEWEETGLDAIAPITLSHNVSIGSGTPVNGAKLSVDGDDNEVQLTVQAHSTQTDSVVIIENSDGTEVATIDVSGLITTAVGLDVIGTGGMDYGSASVTDHTFTTDGTGTAEVVLPAGSIDSTELLDATITTSDISGSAGITMAQTALVAGTNITLSTNTLDVDDAFLTNSASDTMTGTLTADGLELGENENITLGTETLDHDGATFVFSDDVTVSDEVYGAGWDTSIEVPTKNAVFDKIESLGTTLATVPVGAMMIWTTDTAPTDWLLTFGQEVNRTTYADLFTVIGTTYGVGNGSTTFNLPDLRGRFPLGQDDMGGSSANRVSYTEADTLGSSEGDEDDIAAHTHVQNTVNTSDGRATLNMRLGNASGSPNIFPAGTGTFDGNPSGTEGSFLLPTDSAGTTSGNIPPFLTLNYIIFADA